MIYFIKKLKRIGNSKGLVLPKFFLDQAKTDTYKMKLVKGSLIITPFEEEYDEIEEEKNIYECIR